MEELSRESLMAGIFVGGGSNKILEMSNSIPENEKFTIQEIPIEKDSEAFRLITRIQDEAHRFAIEYHRSLRSKNQIHSVLDEIEGIGPARRKALMKHFMVVEKIKEATVEELAEVSSMNEKSAQAVYDFFHKTNA